MNHEMSVEWDWDPKLQEQEQGGNHIGLLLPLSITRQAMSSPVILSAVLPPCHNWTSSTGKFRIDILTNLTFFTTVAVYLGLPPWIEILFQQQGPGPVRSLSRLTTLDIVGDTCIVTVSLCEQLVSLRCPEFNRKNKVDGDPITEEQERALQLLTSKCSSFGVTQTSGYFLQICEALSHGSDNLVHNLNLRAAGNRHFM